MKNLTIQNEKTIVARIDKAETRVEKSLKTFVDDCIFLGEELIEIKKIVGHGEWEKFLNRNSSFRFATSRQASKFIRIAENKIFTKTFAIGESSVDGLNNSIAQATPEQLAKVEELKAEAEQKRLADMVIKIDPVDPILKKQPEILEGEFIEVKAPKNPVETKAEEVKTGFVQIDAKELENIEDSMHELSSLNRSISKDNDSMERIFNANDKLAAAAKEIKRLNDLNTSLEGRLNGFMVERNALIKEAKYWRAKFEKLEKLGMIGG